jgi:hypothetical protein
VKISASANFVNRLSKVFTEHQAGHVDHGKRIYALVALAMWGQVC